MENQNSYNFNSPNTAFPNPTLIQYQPPPPPPPPLPSYILHQSFIPPQAPAPLNKPSLSPPTLIVDNIPNKWKYEEVIQFFLCFGKINGILLKYDIKHHFNGCVLVKFDKINQSNFFSIKMNNFIILNKDKNEDDYVIEISELKSDIFTPEKIPKNIKIPVTNVIRVENLITKGILNNITDLNDFMIDLKEECESYGKVVKYVIPKSKVYYCSYIYFIE